MQGLDENCKDRPIARLTGRSSGRKPARHGKPSWT